MPDFLRVAIQLSRARLVGCGSDLTSRGDGEIRVIGRVLRPCDANRANTRLV